MNVRKIKTNELNRLDKEAFRESEKLPFMIVLDNVRSMHNVGSVFRTADAFRCEQIVLCGITASPPHREITKTAIGAELSMNWKYQKSCIEAVKQLKAEGFLIIAVEQTTKSIALNDYKPTGEKLAVIFGNEIDGVSEEVLEICDLCIEIPQAGTKHSLNVSVAAGIVLWHLAGSQLHRLR